MIISEHSEADIHRLVHDFYAQVRQHEKLGPVFNAHINDWDTHLNTMVDFWSSLLLKTARYTGSPMIKHGRIPELSADLFETWLSLFDQTTARHPNQVLAAQARSYAQRIARSLWMGHQITNNPSVTPLELHHGTN
ncbi:group III truncated hemoglobin [Paenalcaligenes niemegkensis]|uniref:group III truncated hemoglobin n=1 Tax=Paenalcaligenes niemegkensis TaxID=2895469 RepID=UPI001EE84679|nr:group III truncated hemoglobin [Paenalcaligenes niemegkensis]MCQ9617219.1 group III truncated hemoglobin [Paenalcaligenes niemegkensis]